MFRNNEIFFSIFCNFIKLILWHFRYHVECKEKANTAQKIEIHFKVIPECSHLFRINQLIFNVK